MRAAAAALLVLLAGCGGAPASHSASWVGRPVVVHQPELPGDTIVSGTILNEAGETLHLDSDDVRVLDAGGHEVESTARFNTGVTHQLYPPREGPREKDPRFLRERLGQAATVKPGATVPLVVSWRLRPGDDPPRRVELGGASIDLP